MFSALEAEEELGSRLTSAAQAEPGAQCQSVDSRQQGKRGRQKASPLEPPQKDEKLNLSRNSFIQEKICYHKLGVSIRNKLMGNQQLFRKNLGQHIGFDWLPIFKRQKFP